MVRGEIPRAITKILSRDVTMFVSRCGQTLTRPTKHDLDKPPSGGGGEWGGRGGPCVHPHSLEGGKHGSEWRLMCNFVTPTPIAKPKPRSVHHRRNGSGRGVYHVHTNHSLRTWAHKSGTSHHHTHTLPPLNPDEDTRQAVHPFHHPPLYHHHCCP